MALLTKYSKVRGEEQGNGGCLQGSGHAFDREGREEKTEDIKG